MSRSNQRKSVTHTTPPPRPVLQPRAHSLPSAVVPPPSLTVALPPADTGAQSVPPVPPRLQKSHSLAGAATASNHHTHTVQESPLADVSEADDNMANECRVCFERACDSVIYTCGHMCMCYDCAQSVKASSQPLCPICRQSIRDVIRIYKS